MSALQRTIVLVLCVSARIDARSASGVSGSGGGNRITIAHDIGEEMPVGRIFTNLKSSLESRLGAQQGSSREIQFAVIGDQKSARYFNVTRTGTVAIAQKIDREALCSQIQVCCVQHIASFSDSSGLLLEQDGGLANGVDTAPAADIGPCKLELEVTAYVNQQPLRFLFVVTLIDKNDNAPFWPVTSHVLRVREGPKNGHVRHPIPPAIDLDEPRNGVKSYRIVQTLPVERDPTFSITHDGGSSEPLRPYLQQNAALDRETREWYNLTIEARDDLDQVGRLSLFVSVGDANDNPPRLEKTFYNISVPENIDPQELLLYVRAQDADTGANAQLSYSIADYAPSAATNIARVEQTTGRVYLNGQRLDYETQRLHSFLIVVSDAGSPPLSATAIVQIHVIDVNDAAPLMHIANSNLQQQLSLLENQPAGTKVGYLQVSDADTPARQLVCESRTDDFQLTSAGNGIYDILTRRAFDREEQTEVNVTLSCRDGSDSQANQASLTEPVEIIDLNDNTPEFAQSVNGTLYVNVFENNAVNSRVLDVTAVDPDAGDNGVITYRLIGAGANFRVDTDAENRASLVAQTVLDREKTSEYHFWLVAMDRGNPPRTVTVAMVVNVLDINDHAPQFSQKTYSFNVDENEQPGVFVGKVFASDADQQFRDGAVHFFADASAERDFEVRQNGEIYTSRMFDREVETTFNFTVFATDNGQPSARTSAALVIVTIVDENDNQPKFVWQPNATVQISYRSAKAGSVVARITAADADEGTNGHVLYSKAENGVMSTFLLVHPDSGDLVLTRQLAEDDVGLYMVMIEARDGGQPSRSDLMSVTVSIVENVRPEPVSSFWDLGYDAGRARTIMFLSVISALLALALIIASVVIVRCRMKQARSSCEASDYDRRHERQPLSQSQSQRRTPLVVSGRQTNESPGVMNYAPVIDMRRTRPPDDMHAPPPYSGPLDLTSPWYSTEPPAMNQIPSSFNRRSLGTINLRCHSEDASPVSSCEDSFNPAGCEVPKVNPVMQCRTAGCGRKTYTRNRLSMGDEYTLTLPVKNGATMAASMTMGAGGSGLANNFNFSRNPQTDAPHAAIPLLMNQSTDDNEDVREPEARAHLPEASRILLTQAESQAFSPNP